MMPDNQYIALIERLTRIETKQDNALSRADQHDRILYGNGAPGLIAKVEKLETQMQERTTSAPSGGVKVPLISSSVGGAIVLIISWILTQFGVNLPNPAP